MKKPQRHNRKGKQEKQEKKKKPVYKAKKRPDKGRKPKKTYADIGLTRLNKYLANAGVCSRREADKLIQSGVVSINGEIVTKLGTKVKDSDKVQLDGETINPEKNVYLLLNKPKDYITTVDDPQNRKTVMHLLQNACKERVYPVGRLDRASVGLLLFTNDGDLAKKLTHPKHNVTKIYHVQLDKNVSKNHLIQLVEGIQLDDGFVRADVATYVGNGEDKSQIGIELHSGKNRVIRRMMEKMGYKVTKLDRVSFAGLTKKNLPRGKWRFLSHKEINTLKMLK